ncbi:hypothetical protein [Desulfoscipio sp. XC116]|uniref:hypothetical protein n=1 Tax=Desulfoscipio sp. XC116 TaxID=3144975 RepID=UPI00325A8DAB
MDNQVYLGGIGELLAVDLATGKLEQDIAITKALRSLITTSKVKERVKGPFLGLQQDILLVSMFVSNKEYILAFKDGQELGSLIFMPGKVEIWNKSEKIMEKTLPWKNTLIILPKGHVMT